MQSADTAALLFLGKQDSQISPLLKFSGMPLQASGPGAVPGQVPVQINCWSYSWSLPVSAFILASSSSLLL